MTAPAPDATLREVLSHRARRTPESRLWIDVGGGALVALAAVWALPKGAMALIGGGSCLACYGAWAMAERRLTSAPWKLDAGVERRWRTLHRVASFVGLVAFLGFLFGLFALGLGTWTS
ncbi:MAG: hypothetical protein OEW77_00350 [Gemmatimonadota bacterium]|nr:hypothetical protein [Gemmatimonadota bacterium]